MRKRKETWKMLRWKLRLLMADKNISGKELAQLSGLSTVSISRLRTTDKIEQISGNTLDRLCVGLTLAYQARGDARLITPGDLFEFTFDNGGNGDEPALSLENVENSEQAKTSSRSRPKPSTNTKVIQFPAWRVG